MISREGVLANNGAEVLTGKQSKRVRMAATGHVGDPGGAAARGIRAPLRKLSVLEEGRVRVKLPFSKVMDDRVREKFGEDSSHLS